MKKYIILNGDNKNGIACFDENRRKITLNLNGYEKLEKGEYFAVYADGKCIGKTLGSKCSFGLEKFGGGIEVMREKLGTELKKTEYASENAAAVPQEQKQECEECAEEIIKKGFDWRKIRGYYCIKNLEIAKYVMSGENVYSAINKKGYYLFGEKENKFAAAVPAINGDSPFFENVNKFAVKLRINGDEYYAVVMGTDKNGEFFLKPTENT